MKTLIISHYGANSLIGTLCKHRVICNPLLKLYRNLFERKYKVQIQNLIRPKILEPGDPIDIAPTVKQIWEEMEFINKSKAYSKLSVEVTWHISAWISCTVCNNKSVYGSDYVPFNSNNEYCKFDRRIDSNIAVNA